MSAVIGSESFTVGTLPEDLATGAPVAPNRGARLVDGAAGLFAFALVLVVLLQVVGRLKGTPVSWSEELTRALFLWMVFLGLASSMRSADAARVTVLLEMVPALRRIALPVYVLSCLGFFALMAWTGYGMVRQQFAMNETMATLSLPSWVIGAVMPLSALLAAAGTLASLKEHRASIAVLPARSTGERP
jgi:C4-dicarboxylate transporter, DctQ subunit